MLPHDRISTVSMYGDTQRRSKFMSDIYLNINWSREQKGSVTFANDNHLSPTP